MNKKTKWKKIARVKTKWKKIARVFIQVQIWLKRSLSQSEGGGTDRRHVWVHEQAVEGNGPMWRPVVRQGYVGQTAPYRSKEEEPVDTHG